MRVVIAVKEKGEQIYPGPFGHSPFFAVYRKTEAGWEREALLENPYAREEGGQKGRKLLALFGPADLWIGARFGHGHGQHHQPPAPHRVTQATTASEALKEV